MARADEEGGGGEKDNDSNLIYIPHIRTDSDAVHRIRTHIKKVGKIHLADEHVFEGVRHI